MYVTIKSVNIATTGWGIKIVFFNSSCSQNTTSLCLNVYLTSFIKAFEIILHFFVFDSLLLTCWILTTRSLRYLTRVSLWLHTVLLNIYYLPCEVGCSEVRKIGLKPCIDVDKMKLLIRTFNYGLSSAQAKNNLLLQIKTCQLPIYLE